MIGWFEKASECTDYNQQINKMRLSVVYDFIKEFPMLHIQSITRKEIAKYTAWEDQLQWLGEEDKLEEIRQRKARAIRRLGMK